MQAFVSSIPMNLYAVLTLVMIVWLSLRKNSDYGPMATAERRVEKNDGPAVQSGSTDDELARIAITEKGTVNDHIIPVAFLVLFSILAMLFYGGFWDGAANGMDAGNKGPIGPRLAAAFGDTDAGSALSLGGFASLFVAFFLFVPRKLISFTEFFAAVTTGIKAMVPAIIILSLAWTISGVCRDLLATGPYVAGLVERSSLPIALIPAIMFVIAAGLSFATGTSWGTFGILIPITIAVCDIVAPWLSITSLSAVLAGSVFGDHCSPISDTTILSSTGAGCNHIDHVSTQIPYARTVAIVCFVGYIIAGFTSQLGYGVSVGITLPVSFALLIVLLLVLPKVLPGKRTAA
jgi:Na+/H+ antiporter NhaC